MSYSVIDGLVVNEITFRLSQYHNPPLRTDGRTGGQTRRHSHNKYRATHIRASRGKNWVVGN